MECENLFLVGDIIDGWVTRAKRWKQLDSNVIRTILGLAKRGTRICLTPGNHDAFMRRLNGSELGFIEIDDEFIHTTANGKDLVVLHGDFFDPTCRKYSWLAWIGAWAYEYVQITNQKLNKKRKGRRLDFASPLKRLCKGIFTRRNYYDLLLIEYARQHGLDGVICGHIHRPELRILDDGFIYGNTGDWVEHCTVIVEHFDGQLELINWEEWCLEDKIQAASPIGEVR